MKKYLAIITLCVISCIRADYPLELGEGFYCFKNEIYYSKHGQAIDRVFAKCVKNFNYDDNFIVLIKTMKDYPTDTIRDGNGLYVEVFEMDTVYSIIDKHKFSVFETSRYEEFSRVCDSLNIHMTLDLD
ncbi:MAG: hypothetical protein J5965_17015 [Aeriscardovia sp.]|nr:hypothetical protein [Aeriscardovia sp.]